MSKISKFCESDNVLKIFSLLGAALFVADIALSGTLTCAAVYEMLLAFNLLLLYMTFKNHEKNVMKCLMGITFGVLIAGDILFVFDATGGDEVFLLGQVMLTVIDCTLILNHLAINAEHRSNRASVYVSQVLMCLEITVSVLVFVVYFAVTQKDGAAALLQMVVETAAFACLIITLVCIQTRVDSYKLIRDAHEDAGTWNDQVKAETKEKIFGK